MRWSRLVRAELRKLTTTRLPWAFLAVLGLISAITAIAVVAGTDMDGSKGFIATADDQRSLFAFGWNAMMIAGFFGAIAAAREYGHGTVVPTFLVTPRRHVAALAQFTAILVGGAVVGLVGGGLTILAGVVSLPLADQDLLLSAGDVLRLVTASGAAGALGALLGAGIGVLVRNTGGAVTGAVVALIIAPPLIAQLAGGAGSWVPSTLVNVLAGVGEGPTIPAALAALLAWAVVPALAGMGALVRRDVV